MLKLEINIKAEGLEKAINNLAAALGSSIQPCSSDLATPVLDELIEAAAKHDAELAEAAKEAEAAESPADEKLRKAREAKDKKNAAARAARAEKAAAAKALADEQEAKNQLAKDVADKALADAQESLDNAAAAKELLAAKAERKAAIYETTNDDNLEASGDLAPEQDKRVAPTIGMTVVRAALVAFGECYGTVKVKDVLKDSFNVIQLGQLSKDQFGDLYVALDEKTDELGDAGVDPESYTKLLEALDDCGGR